MHCQFGKIQFHIHNFKLTLQFFSILQCICLFESGSKNCSYFKTNQCPPTSMDSPFLYRQVSHGLDVVNFAHYIPHGMI